MIPTKIRLLPALAAFTAAGLVLTACGGSSQTGGASTAPADASSTAASSASTVTIQDNRGEVTVPTPPKSVIVTDNRLFEPLYDWGVKLAAAPVDLMAEDAGYKKDSSIVNLGNHREPNLEAAVAVNPDLVINGQRFANQYDAFKALVPDAAFVDLDVRDGQPFDKELIRQVTIAGEIFGKQDEAAKLVSDFEASIARVKAAYKPDAKVLGIITSGGKINYAAPTTGRTLGPVYDILGLTPALGTEGSTDHQGDEISVEAIAQANPDWILVMDRDAAVGSEDGTVVPAEQMLKDSAALQNVTALQKNQVVIMPPDTYVNEGIQTYTEFFNSLADAMEATA